MKEQNSSPWSCSVTFCSIIAKNKYNHTCAIDLTYCSLVVHHLAAQMESARGVKCFDLLLKSNFQYFPTIYWPAALFLSPGLNFQSGNNIKWQSSVHQCCVLGPGRSHSDTPLDGSNVPLKTHRPPLPFTQRGTCMWCMRLCMNVLPSECFFRWI